MTCHLSVGHNRITIGQLHHYWEITGKRRTSSVGEGYELAGPDTQLNTLNTRKYLFILSTS